MKVLVVQADLKWEDAEANRNHIELLIHKIREAVDIILLPEMFTTGFTMNSGEFAEDADGPTSHWLKRIAKEYKVTIGGTIIFEEMGKYYNRLLWVNPDQKISYYDKRHLFRMGSENKHFSKGNKPLIIDYLNWRIMPLICYDLRFPVWSRNSFSYDILIYHSNWPAVRNHVWECLLKARAIENQAYVIGINRVGKDGEGVEYHGNSLVFNAKGRKILQLGNKEMTGIVDLSIEELHEFRNKFPSLQDKDNFTIN